MKTKLYKSDGTDKTCKLAILGYRPATLFAEVMEMAELIKECPWCHKKFKAKTSRRVFCSDECRRANHNWMHTDAAVTLTRELEPVQAMRHPVTKEEVADAIVSVRAAVAVFGAGKLTALPSLRPVCERLEEAIASALEKEEL